MKKEKHRIFKEHHGVMWAANMQDAWKPRRGTMSDKSRDGVYIWGTPYGRGRPVGGAKTTGRCKRADKFMSHPSAKDRQWPNGNRGKEELRKYARENEETGKEKQDGNENGARTRIDRGLDLVLCDPQTLMKGLEALKTETKGERVQGVGFKEFSIAD
ncbi:hypothetical protein K438DRAFT_1781869 [Mycena galopus ATCC 62051]|nr:hypothetical protein K438DRAFT_1781869 [Mycena galopus ATCC 62051]